MRPRGARRQVEGACEGEARQRRCMYEHEEGPGSYLAGLIRIAADRQQA